MNKIKNRSDGNKQTGLFEEVSNELLTHDHQLGEDNRAWPKTLAELVDVMANHLEQTLQLEKSNARRQAKGLALLIARQFGGQPVYIPKGHSLQKELRDLQIWHEFNGNNIKELSRRYDLTSVQIYGIIKRQRNLRLKKIQEDMFNK